MGIYMYNVVQEYEKKGKDVNAQKPRFSSEFAPNSFWASMQYYIEISCNFYSKRMKIFAQLLHDFRANLIGNPT